MAVTVRKVRHWKQRWNPDADFIFRRVIKWGGKIFRPGDAIPTDLKRNRGKLRRLWDSQFIELANWPAKPLPPKKAAITLVKASWHTITLPDGSTRRVNGKLKAQAMLAELNADG